MGVFTPLLNLFKPDSLEFVDVVSQLNANFDKIDTLAGAIGGGVWQTYVPVWSADVTQPAIGNGVLQGRYRQLGKTVNVLIDIVWGTTTANGNGTYSFSLPPGMLAKLSQYFSAGALLNSGANGFFLAMGIIMVNSNTFIAVSGAQGAFGLNNNVTHNTPGVWGNGSKITYSFTIEIA